MSRASSGWPSPLHRFLCLALVALLPAPAHAQQAALRGDVNGDGRVSAADAQAVRDHVAGRPAQPGWVLLPNGDANGDGRITAVDAAMIQAFAAGRDVSRFGVGRPVPDGEGKSGGLTVAYECTVDVQAATHSCQQPRPGGAPGEDLILGKAYVSFITTGAASSRGNTANEDTMTLNVALVNQIRQPIGTVDGVTPSPNGNRLFFHSGPTVVSVKVGTKTTETVRMDNPTGLGTFANTAGTYVRSNVPYYQYDGILHPGGQSAPKLWRFVFSANVKTFSYFVYVSAPVQHELGWVALSAAADTLTSGETTTPEARVFDFLGAEVAGATVAWGTSDAAVATVSAAGLVTAVGPGSATISATSGARSGSLRVAVCPVLAVGEVYTAEMPAGASFCLGGQAAGAEYTVVPVNASAAGSVSLAVTGSGIVGVSGAPTPNRIPGVRTGGWQGSTQPDGSFEAGLRRMERRELAGRRPAAGRAAQQRIPGARLAITPGVPSTGTLMSLNVETDNACSTSDVRTGRVVAVGTHSIVMADTLNPSGGLTSAQYQAIADTFDLKIYPAIAGVYGTPSDIDGNGRVVLFYTRAVNELTPPGSSAYVGGFVFSRDLVGAGSCPTSNVGEMFYMLAADPGGEVNGNPRSITLIMSKTFGTLAHEFQHLINASRRMHVNAPWNGKLEETWLDEGLSHIAEELVFYQESGLAPGGNTGLAQLNTAQRQTAFLQYGESNFGRLRQWLLNPHASGAFQGDDDLATRGAAWAFLRYAADRSGATDATFFRSLVNTGHTGMANLQQVLGSDPLPWFRDFAAATYADDAAGTPTAPYRQASWNFRSLFAALDYDPGPACSCAFPLAVRNPASGVTDHLTLESGGAAAYLRMGVAANAFGGVTVSSAGTTPPATVRVAVVRRR